MAKPNLRRFEPELAQLVAEGWDLLSRLYLETMEERFVASLRGNQKELQRVRALPSFISRYQIWYSEAKAVVTILLSQRLNDFVQEYERPKSRSRIEPSNYVISDMLQGVSGPQGEWGMESAVPRFQQQLFMLQACQARLSSVLYDLQEIVQADLFSSEIDAAESLAQSGFHRAAGAWVGVLLERHLRTISASHELKLGKRTPTLKDYNEALKTAHVIDVPTWRLIQHLADLRNLAAHEKEREPTKDQIYDLIAGVRKIVSSIS